LIWCKGRSIVWTCCDGPPMTTSWCSRFITPIADGWSLGVFVQDLCTAYVMGLSGFRKAVAVRVMGLSNTLPPVPQTYSEWAAAERAFWQPAEPGSASGFLEGTARRLSPNLERYRGAGYRLGRASAPDFPFSRRAYECRAGTRPPQRGDALQHLARRVSGRAVTLDGRARHPCRHHRSRTARSRR